MLVIYVACLLLGSFNVHDYGSQGCYPFEGGDSVVVVSLFFVIAPIVSVVLCWVLVLQCGSLCPFWFSFHLSEEERAGCFTLIVLLLSVFYVSYSRCRGLVRSLWCDISSSVILTCFMLNKYDLY